MYYSWLFALAYTAIYSIAIFVVKYKAKQRLNDHKTRKNSMKKGLMAHQHHQPPNQGKINEDAITNPDYPPNTTSTQKTTTTKPNRRLSESSNTIDLSTLHHKVSTSMPYGAPVSNWETFVAILHSLDSGIKCVNIWIILIIF